MLFSASDGAAVAGEFHNLVFPFFLCGFAEADSCLLPVTGLQVHYIPGICFLLWSLVFVFSFPNAMSQDMVNTFLSLVAVRLTLIIRRDLYYSRNLETFGDRIKVEDLYS